MAPVNRHTGLSEEELKFLTDLGIDPLEFLRKLKEAGLVDDPKGIFHTHLDSIDFFTITQKGRDLLGVLKIIEEAEQMASTSSS